MESWHSLRIEEIYLKLNASDRGLASEGAEERLKEYGQNVLPSKKKTSAFQMLAEQFTSPLVILLIISASVMLALDFFSKSSGHLTDATLILIIVVINSLFGFFQNFKAEQSMEALMKKAVTKALVLRDSEKKMVDSQLLVPGDVIFVGEGSIVPADCRIIEESDLAVDESMLTGESMPVSKKGDFVPEKEAELAERKNMLYMGSVAVRGSAKAIVVGTGSGTEVGKIAGYISEAVELKTPFQKELDLLARQIAIAVGVLIVFIAATEILAGNMRIEEIAIIAIALAVAAIPEGLPAVVTLTMSISTRKMLAKNALVRKLSIVETLGAVDIICSDKTGTITEGRMAVEKFYFNGKIMSIDDSMKNKEKGIEKMLLASVICNNASTTGEFQGDPTEVALLKAAEFFGVKKEESEKEFRRIKEIAFSSERKMMSAICEKDGTRHIFSKGAPEVMLEKCSRILIDGKEKIIDAKTREEIEKSNKEMAGEALRVICIAYKDLKSAKDEKEEGLVFLGLEGMIDPPRKGVRESIETCLRAGIRPIMITGDNLITAKAIAKSIGLEGRAIEGKEIEKMSDEELKRIVGEVSIYARTIPNHKFRILKALQGRNYVVAMTGDGINDAPAIKQADVGIAMGLKGTDVSRQASDIVLLDDNFSSIVEAIREGRTIFYNIRKFLTYLFMCNFAEVFVVFFASFMSVMPITAVQILWINLITDGMPALALGLDPAQKGIMEEKPKGRKERIIDKRMVASVLGVGMEITVIILAVFFIGLSRWGPQVATTMAFTSFIIYEMVKIVVVREAGGLSLLSNKWLNLAIIASFALQMFVVYGPFNRMFGVVPLGIEQWLVMLAGGLAGYVFSMVIIKAINKKVK